MSGCFSSYLKGLTLPVQSYFSYLCAASRNFIGYADNVSDPIAGIRRPSVSHQQGQRIDVFRLHTVQIPNLGRSKGIIHLFSIIYGVLELFSRSQEKARIGIAPIDPVLVVFVFFILEDELDLRSHRLFRCREPAGHIPIGLIDQI